MTSEIEALRQYQEKAYKEVWGEIAGNDPVISNVTYFLSRSQGRHRPPRPNPREVVLFEWPSGRFHSWDRDSGNSGRGPWDSIATEVLSSSVSPDEAETELHHRINREVRRLRENR